MWLTYKYLVIQPLSRHRDKIAIALEKNEELSECVNLIVTFNNVIIMVSLVFSLEILSVGIKTK